METSTSRWLPFSWSSGGSSSLTNSTLMWNSTATIRATFSNTSCSCWIPVRHNGTSKTPRSHYGSETLSSAFTAPHAHWCGRWLRRRICRRTFWRRGLAGREWCRARGATRCSWRMSPSSRSPPPWLPSEPARWRCAGRRGLLQWWGTKKTRFFFCRT